jgi:ABC-2 type transport system permease protein
MKALITQLKIQFIMDFREKSILLTFYLVPLVFFAVMGAVFSSINPGSKQTLSASMSIFAITMGAVIGMPAPMVKMREAGVLRAYKVNGIPGWALLLVQAISAALHLMVVAVIIFIAAPLLFGASLPLNCTAYFIILVIILFASISIGLLIGVVAHSQSAATMFSQAVFLPSLLLGGLMFPSSMLPGPMMWLGRLFPATHAMEAFFSWAYGLESKVAPAVSLVAAVAIGIIVLVLAIWRYNRISRTM